MTDDAELDPRIQVELENLNSATDEINKLEIELEEANSTFRILLNESTRRLKLLSKKLGNCIDKARPYYEAAEKARIAQIECQAAAVEFRRANEIHAAAKETVALAEQRFMSNSHEWQFDNAWQEMLNHATLKVMDAEKQKADTNTEHQKKTHVFHDADAKVQNLEDRLRRNIIKSRPYFDEKQICQDQLQTQKERIQELQQMIQKAKNKYSTSLRSLEQISEDIHRKRAGGDAQFDSIQPPPGPREPGVGAEWAIDINLESINRPSTTILTDLNCDPERFDQCSVATSSMAASECDPDDAQDLDLDALKEKMKEIAIRPIEGGDGQQSQDMWECELNATVNKIDRIMMLRDTAQACADDSGVTERTCTSVQTTPIKKLQKADPLSSVNVSMRELPLLARISKEVIQRSSHLRRRSLE